jgi:putative oxidoreductase
MKRGGSNVSCKSRVPRIADADPTNRYPHAAEWAYALLRVAAGLMLVPHVWPKLMAGPTAIAANVMASRGLEPSLFFAYAAIAFELAGIILITLGLFTRIMAVLLVIEFVFIVYVHSASGGWAASTQGAEFPFIWLIVWIFIAVRGGGPYSLDAKLNMPF